MKNTLLAATAIVAFTAGSAFAAGHPGAVIHGPKIIGTAKPLHSPAPLGGPGGLLYSQNTGGTGSYVSSQNFTSGTFASFNDAGADDFVMPSGSITGGVTELDVTGLYTVGPSNSEIISFYANKPASSKIPYSHPGKLRYTFTVKCVSAPVYSDFECALPYTTITKKGVVKYKAAAKLKPGKTYWVSIVANMSFTGGAGQWYWAARSPDTNDQAVWENPGLGWNTYYGGYNCPTWQPDSQCYSSTASDLMFAIYG